MSIYNNNKYVNAQWGLTYIQYPHLPTYVHTPRHIPQTAHL